MNPSTASTSGRPRAASGQTYRGPYRSILMRAFNVAGRGLDRVRDPRPIEAPRIVAEAQANTGLKDLGDESFLEPLEILCRSIRSDAALNPLGRMCVRYGLSNFVANRLRVQRDLVEDPTLAEQPIRRPIFVIGMPRTGSTYLHRMLAAVPGCRTPMTWECYWPAPVFHRGEKGRQGRRDQMARLVWFVERLAPGMRSIHPLSVDAAEETTLMMANTFVTWTFSLMAAVREYDAWLWSDPEEHVDAAYRHLRLQLQDLQSQVEGERRWVLKSPMHLHGLESLLRAFPDACIVQTHRDPRKSVPSACSLFSTLRGIASDRLDPVELGDEVAGRLCTAVERTDRVRERWPDRFHDVRYDDLVSDPERVVETILRRFGFGYDEASRKAVAGSVRRQAGAPTHRYTLGQFGLSEDRIETLFGDYCHRHGLAAPAS